MICQSQADCSLIICILWTYELNLKHVCSFVINKWESFHRYQSVSPSASISAHLFCCYFMHLSILSSEGCHSLSYFRISKIACNMGNWCKVHEGDRSIWNGFFCWVCMHSTWLGHLAWQVSIRSYAKLPIYTLRDLNNNQIRVTVNCCKYDGREFFSDVVHTTGLSFS